MENYDFHEIDKMMDNKDMIEWKNQKLIPIYEEVKQIIKHMKVDKQFIYYQELKMLELKLEQKHVDKGEEYIEDKKKQLQMVYEKMIGKWH